MECFGIVRDSHNFIVPGAGYTKIIQQVPYSVIPKRVAPQATSFTVYTTFFNFPTPRTKLLQADEIRHMLFCLIRIQFFCVVSKSLNTYNTLLSLIGKTSLSSFKHRWPTIVFWLKISQNRLLHSWFPCVTRATHVAQSRLRSQVDFLFDVICGSRKTFGS